MSRCPITSISKIALFLTGMARQHNICKDSTQPVSWPVKFSKKSVLGPNRQTPDFFRHFSPAKDLFWGRVFVSCFLVVTMGILISKVSQPFSSNVQTIR